MNVIDEIREAMQKQRRERKVNPKGQLLFELNTWLGEERKRLKEEYEERKAAIEDAPDDVPQEILGKDVLHLVARAVGEGVSRSAIRVALGKKSLEEVDDIIIVARGALRQDLATGDAKAYSLKPTGEIHAKGWPMYSVVMHDTDETFESIYIVTLAGRDEITRASMRITPSPPGSVDILNRMWEAGVGHEILARGKGD